ncbi:AI-2E family transporter [Corynebacterium dentalis]|uniref:AI-2E family transporter n=1 Tax=Corynebacterium dentalis TaxID=2014528 RepID=UPI00289E4765|nr:AI-2E family transporter [Corynebacterium dentalis]
MSPNKRDDEPRSEHNGRDFADFLAGSERLDPEATLPLPESPDSTALGGDPSEPPTVPTGVDGDGSDDRSDAEHSLPVDDSAEGKAVKAHDLDPDDESLQKELRENEGLRPEVRDRAEVIGTSVRWFAGWCLRFLIMVAAGYVLSNVIGKLWAGILPILLSLIVCTVLWPVVSTLRKFHIPNALAVLLTIVGFFAVIGGVFWMIAPSAVSQTSDLVDKANHGLTTIQDWISGPPLNLEATQLNDALDKGTAWLQERSGTIATQVAAGASATLSALVTLLIVLVLTFFFLKDGEHFLPMVRRVTGRRVGWHLTEVLTRMWNTLGGFIRTQALVSFIDAFFIGIGLVILGVPLAGFLAVITFFAGFIPMIGAFTAGALSVLVALVANDFTTAVIVLVIIIAVQQLEGNILQPVLQSRAMNVHPVIILLAITIGSTLFSIIGAFLAVPVAAMVMVAFRYMGDLTDLATGEKTSSEIKFSTTAGALTGAQSEKAAKRNFAKSEQKRSMAEKLNITSLLNPLRGNDKSAKNEK